MASEERKAADNKIKEQNFQKSLGAGEQQAETDAFQCQRCKQVRFNSYPFPPPRPTVHRRANVVTDRHKQGVPMNL